MSRLASRALIALAAAAFALVGMASAVLEPKSSDRGGVTVKVTPRNLAGSVWEFEVVMDTHTQPLTDDLMRSAVLVTTEGDVAPTAWTGDGPSGHHRKGLLTFKAPASQQPIITIRLARPGETQAREFQWQRR